MNYKILFMFLAHFPILSVIATNGICTTMTRVSFTKRESYKHTEIEKYITRCYARRRCRKTRIKISTKWRNVQDYRMQPLQQCCSGYTKDEKVNMLACKPVCIPSCINGQCVQPAKCSCNSGYIPSGKRNECLPHCDSDCVHGKCTAPNTCTCNYGYNLNNQICTPICVEACVNATCTAPDTCSCLPGYRSTNNSRVCSSYCSSGCLNGKCSAPEVCECDTGYKHVEGRCVPICEGGCGTGRCTAPGICTCDEGHELKVDMKCAPHCDSCDNGDCVAPGMCHCHTGYNMTQQGICKPVCENPCDNGFCSSPNICTCTEGYYKIKNQCHPICDECVNGFCIAPQQCKCLEGYSLNNNTHCYPTCEPVCNERQYCKTPNACDCLPGYKTVNFTCIPVCNDCRQACIAPDVCECPNGYYFTNSSRIDDECMPACKKCENGTCVAPNVCHCKESYNLVNESCVPVCDNCHNGVCIAPNKCECNNGYLATDKGCVPDCHNCTNGLCIDTGVCECIEGYSKNVEGICQIDCPNCENGRCVASQQCECLHGFRKYSAEGSCLPENPYEFEITSESVIVSEIAPDMFTTENITLMNTTLTHNAKITKLDDKVYLSNMDTNTTKESVSANNTDQIFEIEDNNFWMYFITAASVILVIATFMAVYALYKCIKYRRNKSAIKTENAEGVEITDDIKIVHFDSKQAEPLCYERIRYHKECVIDPISSYKS